VNPSGTAKAAALQRIHRIILAGQAIRNILEDRRAAAAPSGAQPPRLAEQIAIESFNDRSEDR
jgi:hypothetical protein